MNPSSRMTTELSRSIPALSSSLWLWLWSPFSLQLLSGCFCWLCWDLFLTVESLSLISIIAELLIMFLDLLSFQKLMYKKSLLKAFFSFSNNRWFFIAFVETRVSLERRNESLFLESVAGGWSFWAPLGVFKQVRRHYQDFCRLKFNTCIQNEIATKKKCIVKNWHKVGLTLDVWYSQI